MSFLDKFSNTFTKDKFQNSLKTALKKYGYQISQKVDNDTYKVSKDKFCFDIDVSSLHHTTSQNEYDTILEQLIKVMEADSETEKRMVSFTNAQVSLRFIVMREEDVTNDLIYTDFVSNLKKVVVYTPDDTLIHTLDKSYLKKWDVPKEVLFSVADRNMCRLLTKVNIHEGDIKDGIRVLELSLDSKALCVSLMMCNDFRSVISRYFGPKFLVVAPSYDSLLVLENVTNNILEGLGMVIINEYKKAEKPLTTDVLLFDPTGVNVAGRFSVKEEVTAEK